MRLATQRQGTGQLAALLSTRCNPRWRRHACRMVPVLFFLVLFFEAPAFAQAQSLADRLPPNTWAYLSWSGTASLKSVSGTNSALRAWSDPAFREFLENSIGTVSHEGGPTQKFGGMTPEHVAQMFSALENPLVLGLVNSGASENKDHNPIGFFLVYDATGKQELLETFRHQRDANNTQPVQRSSLPVGDITVEKRAYPSSATFEAQAGPYYILTQSLQTMEELLPRFEGTRARSAAFMQSAGFPAECRNMSQSSALNVTIVPTRLHIPASAQNGAFDFHAFASSLHLDRIRAGCMSVTFEKEMTRFRGVVLGDTSAGSILNVLGSERDSFATLALASPNSSFHVTVVDFAALYNSLFTAVSAALPSDKAPMVAAATAFLSSSWGMPPDQFLRLFTGEFATIHPDTAVDPSQTLYAMPMRDPEKVAHVFQNILPGAHATVRQDGDVTYITVRMSAPERAKTGVSDPTPNYVAITPTMLLSSKQEEAVRNAVARLRAAPRAAQTEMLSSDPDFQKARATLPAKLDSLSYTNYSHYNWRKVLLELEKTVNERIQQAAASSNKPAPPRVQLFQGVDTTALSRYLHVSVGGAWKDANGIHFESTIQ